MWMTNRMAQERLEEPAAELGQVTLGEGGTGVALAGERRDVSLCLPGGYYWTPSRGDTVLVVKSGADQAPCLVGKRQDPADLSPGEVYLSGAEGAGIRLKTNGTIELSGAVTVTGSLTVNGKEV